MRCLLRNKTLFHYCPYVGKTAVTSSGYETGEYTVSYGTAVAVRGNVSPAQGSARMQMFGVDIQYDKVIVLDDPAFPMDEHSVLFVDKAPTYDTAGNPLYDYIVVRVSRSLNSVSYAIRRANVS